MEFFPFSVDPAVQKQSLLEPSSLGASVYDDCLTILTRHPEAIKNARMFNGLPILKFIPAIKIVGGAVSKIFNGPYAGFMSLFVRIF